MSTDMFPDDAIDYLVEHSDCPADHSRCLVEEKKALESGTSSHDDITGGYDAGQR